MKRLALALALFVAAPLAGADEPPPWMPSTPRGPSARAVNEARAIRHEAAIFGGIGLAVFGAGVAVTVVALDVPQGEHRVSVGDGGVTTQRFRDDANWAELAGGVVLLATGLGLVGFSLLKIKQARRLESE
jgi:hypothetical protein